MKMVTISYSSCALLMYTIVSLTYSIDYNLDNLNLKQKQIFAFKILNHITELSFYEDIVTIAKEFKIEENLDSFKNTEDVKKYIKDVKRGKMHPRGESFCIFCGNQLEQAIRTFHVLYYANDFSTFLKTSCWLRQNVNELMFAYAFFVAVRHRDDCKSLILPSIYEVYPFLFIKQTTIQTSEIIKMKMNILDDDLNTDFGVKQIGIDTIEIDDKNNLYLSEDDKLSYFIKDIGLNTYYYNFHIDYPFWMGDEVFGLAIDRRGELYIYLHRQLLARYYLERLSNSLCDIDSFEPEYSIVSGVDPETTLHNGWALPLRSNNAQVGKEKTKILKEIFNFEHRLRDAVVNGFILSFEGAKIDMRKVEGVEVLGRRIYGNLDKSDRDLLYFYELMARNLLSNEINVNDIQMPTSALQFYEKALTDPVFWNLQKSTMELVEKFYHDHVRSAHRRDDLFFPGVKISSVSVGKLTTFFERHSIDITNVVPTNIEEEKLEKEKLKIFASRDRLNHVQFDVKINAQSDKVTNCIVRIYLGPKYDCYGREIRFEDNVHNFVELDISTHTLNVGNNTITRNSSEFNNVIVNRELTRDLWKHYEDNNEIDVSSYLHRHSGFPSNLILPKGTKGGLSFKFFVMISSLEKQRSYYGFNAEEVLGKKLCRFNLCLHSVPLGFPFNKKIDEETLSLPNIRFVDVIIFHKNINGQH